MHILFPERKVHGTNDHHGADDREVCQHHDTEKDHAGTSGQGVDVEDDSHLEALEVKVKPEPWVKSKTIITRGGRACITSYSTRQSETT